MNTKKGRLQYDLPIFLGMNEEDKPVIHDLAQDHLNIITNNEVEAANIIDCLTTHLINNNLNQNFKFVFLGSDGKNMNRFDHLIGDCIFLPLYNIMIGEGKAKAELFLDLLFDEIDRRNDILLSTHSRNFKVYNAKETNKVPHIVIFINDYQELLKEQSVRFSNKLAQLAVYGLMVNFHVVLLTSYKKEFKIPFMISENYKTQIAFNGEFINSYHYNDFKSKRPIVDLGGYGDALYIWETGKKGKWQSEQVQFPLSCK